ncbi:MAG: hypothetical protein JNL67_07530 [Planctomycetaceae bacterium]|nr:hypothetical protein [Planctomycetaceae bacterium]
MNIQISFSEIDETNFTELYRNNPTEAEDRLEILICEPNLVSQRIKSLLARKLQSKVAIDEWDRDISRFASTIDAIRELGVIPALHADRTTFAELIQISEHPRAILAAHDAMYADSTDKDSASGVAEDRFEQLMDNLIACCDNQSEYVSLTRQYSVNALDLQLTPALCGAAEDTRSTDYGTEDIIVAHERIMLDVPRVKIPHGLCILTVCSVQEEVAVKNGQKVIKPKLDRMLRIEPKLELINGRWFWEASIDILFAAHPRRNKVRTFWIIASDATRPMFENQRIRNFVQQLDEGPQKAAADSFLKSFSKVISDE